MTMPVSHLQETKLQFNFKCVVNNVIDLFKLRILESNPRLENNNTLVHLVHRNIFGSPNF